MIRLPSLPPSDPALTAALRQLVTELNFALQELENRVKALETQRGER